MLRSNGFRESRDHVVRLPGDEVASFAVFAEWLYLGQECDSGDVWIDGHGKDLNDAESSEFLGASLPPASQGKKLAAKKADKDDDEGYEGEGEGGGEDEDEDYENERARLPKKDKQEGPSANGTADVDEDEDRWETGSTVSSRGRHDYYDFSLQFSCYVLADKILAPGFKRHILDEIRMHGEFYQPSSLTPAMIQYVYRNTALRDDPLRKFCIYLKCVKEPIQETLADPEFQALMEQGGPLVKDVMEVCRKLSLKGPGWQKEAFEGLNLEDGYVPAGPSVTWEYRKAVLEGYLESISKDPEERTDPPAS
jgi:Ni/Co efflux regulator RcnB